MANGDERKRTIFDIIKGTNIREEKAKRRLPAFVRDEAELANFLTSLSNALSTPQAQADIDLLQALSPSLTKEFPAAAPRTAPGRQNPLDQMLQMGIDPRSLGFGQ